jgi:DNA adenine methylase
VSKLPNLANVPHALPYQGSKRLLAHAIVRLIPTGTPKLIEPFAGSAAIAIAARFGHYAEHVAINDINEPLMELWRRIVSDPNGLADDYHALWQEQQPNPRDYYTLIRTKFNATHEPHFLLYLLARCVKAAVRYSKSGEFNQSPDNRRLGAHPKKMRDRLVRTSQALSCAEVSTGDYVPHLLGAAETSVVYLDPPYQGVSNVHDHRYVRGLERREFEGALHQAVHDGKSFCVSYDEVTADKKYGETLSPDLKLTHIHVAAGRSSQATLQGLTHTTTESLYVSPALVDRLGGVDSLPAKLTAS